MLDEALAHGATIEWESKVTGTGQDGEKAWVEIEGKGRREADYVVGCDGANSIVRRSLFGDEFPGFTWDAQIIATNVSLLELKRNMTGLTGYARPIMTLRASLGGMMQTSLSTRSTSL